MVYAWLMIKILLLLDNNFCHQNENNWRLIFSQRIVREEKCRNFLLSRQGFSHLMLSFS
jgi:hypothetical protein